MNKNMPRLGLRVALCAVAALAFATSAFAANNLTVTAPGLNSTGNKLQVNLDFGAAGNNVFVESQHPNDETHYRIRFWINPAGLQITPDTSVRIAAIGSNENGQRLLLFLRHDVPDDNPGNPIWALNAWGMEDSGAPSTYRFLRGVFVDEVASPGANQFEVEWTRSTGAAQANSIFRIQRIAGASGGGANQQISNLVMFNFDVDYIRVGALAGSGANATADSSFAFDEFESYR